MPVSKTHNPKLIRSSAAAAQMKTFTRRTHHHHLLLLRKYYKYVLWFALSLYLFFSTASYPGARRTSLDKTTLRLRTTTPRALMETTTSDLSTSPFPDVKVYIYQLPTRFNKDWLSSDARCDSHLFAAEVALHEALLSSPARSVDPTDADFFFVPVYVSCNFSTPNGFPSLRHARSLLADAVAHVSSLYPFWNRSAGSDHLFVASHDYGACFHAMEDVAIADGLPEFMKNSIIMQTFGVDYQHACQAAAHILIPPHVLPETATISPHPEQSHRDIWVYFRGKMEVHPKNISGRFYGKRVRTEIWERFGAKKRFYVQRKRYENYKEEIARAVYCLCPRGWAPWSPRLVEAVALGCVPVIIADGISLPFDGAVPWKNISLTVAERDIGSLETVLNRVDRTNLSVIQRNLWDPRVREALIYNRPMKQGDATWQVLKALEGMIHRSWRRRSALL